LGQGKWSSHGQSTKQRVGKERRSLLSSLEEERRAITSDGEKPSFTPRVGKGGERLGGRITTRGKKGTDEKGGFFPFRMGRRKQGNTVRVGIKKKRSGPFLLVSEEGTETGTPHILFGKGEV